MFDELAGGIHLLNHLNFHDAQTREVLQGELLRIWEQHRKTIVFITHSLEEAVYLSDRVAVMTQRPGRIKDIIHIPLARPRSPALRHSG